MTFWPVTGRQRSARSREFLANELPTRSGQQRISRPSPHRTQDRLSSTGTSVYRSATSMMQNGNAVCPQNPPGFGLWWNSFAGLPDVQTWDNRKIEVVSTLLLRPTAAHGKRRIGLKRRAGSRGYLASDATACVRCLRRFLNKRLTIAA
jgi:hypothetical protein